MTSVPDASLYPSAYRTSPGWMALCLLLGAVLAIGGTVGVWFIAERAKLNQPAVLFSTICVGALAALGAYCILSVIRSRVLLFPDRIEARYSLRNRVLLRDEILGWRTPTNLDYVFILVARDADRPTIKIDSMIKLDETFCTWIDAFPCLDEEVGGLTPPNPAL